jgi:hypothetical protein
MRRLRCQKDARYHVKDREAFERFYATCRPARQHSAENVRFTD